MTRNCEYCGQELRTWRNRVNRGLGKFCSQKCCSDAQVRYAVGDIAIHDAGYILVKLPDHPRARRGFVYEHILVAEHHLGRPLESGEIVHHENGLPFDNRFENLHILSGQSEHAKLHSRERAIAQGIADPVNFKRCRTCKEIKLRSEFSPSCSKGKPQLNSQCKPCAAAWQREYKKTRNA